MSDSDNKKTYDQFCEDCYVPIYSKPWWLDAICGSDNWDVWLYGNDGCIFAAMPYYLENRDGYKYITKAPLTQNNGIIFNYPCNLKKSSKREFEERVIDSACQYIKSLGLDVYEQQFQTSFTDWLPFFWNYYDATVRYTYIFTKYRLSNLEQLWTEVDKKKRSKIKKGQRLCSIREDLAPESFYNEVEKTFKKQNLQCPFSYNLWLRLYTATQLHDCSKIIYAVNDNDEILSTVFLVWDEERMYQLISGGSVEFQHYEGKSALVWHAIEMCSSKKLIYDFEGSVIKRISKSNNLFGAEPVPYFRIRKIFNPEIIKQEAENKMNQLISSSRGGYNLKPILPLRRDAA